MGAILLHGVALHSLLFGSLRHNPPPDTRTEGATTARESTVEDLVLVTGTAAPEHDPDYIEQIAALRSALARLSIPNVTPDQPLPVEVSVSEDVVENNDAPPAIDSGDPALQAMMRGRYIGQIRARIERAWIRPRSSVDDSGEHVGPVKTSEADKEFMCRVQIRQDALGNVEEVLLLECNGSEAWRQSLVVAINQSSPLPAPPTPSVFSRGLNVTFDSQSYRPGMAPDGYAIEKRVEFPGRAAAGAYSDQLK